MTNVQLLHPLLSSPLVITRVLHGGGAIDIVGKRGDIVVKRGYTPCLRDGGSMDIVGEGTQIYTAKEGGRHSW